MFKIEAASYKAAVEQLVTGGTNLNGADLSGAYLRDADLRSTNLRGADLSGAYVGNPDWVLIGKRPYLSISPIGSRADSCALWLTNKGPFIQTGCFFNTLHNFKTQVENTHGDGIHGIEYQAAIVLFEAHIAIWTP